MSNFYQPQVASPFATSWPQMQQPMQPQILQSQQMQQPIQEPPIIVIPVNGEQSAKAYPLERGRTIFLMDFNNKRFWIRSIKPNGLEEVCDGYSFISDADAAEMQRVQLQKQQEAQAQATYVNRTEFDELKKIVEDLMK